MVEMETPSPIALRTMPGLSYGTGVMDGGTIPTSSGPEVTVVGPGRTDAMPPNAPKTPVTGGPDGVVGADVIIGSNVLPCGVYRAIGAGGASIGVRPRE